MKQKWIAAAMLCTLLLSSCSENAIETESTTAPDTTVAETETTVEEPAVYPGTLQDLGGYTFTFLNVEDNFWPAAHHILDYDEDSGTATNSAVFWRNRKAEEDLNMTIEVAKDSVLDLYDIMHTAIMAGDDLYDVVYLCLQGFGHTSFGADDVMDLMTISTMHLDKEWWNQQFIQDATIQGELRTTVDYVNRMGFVYCNSMFFNYDMMIDMGLEVPYDHVREGTWTYDTMFTYMANVPSMGTQSSWDAKLDGDAVYGFACEHEEGFMALLEGSGVFMTTKAEGDIPQIRTDNNVLLDAYDTLIAGMSPKGACVMINLPDLQATHIFQQGRCMFYPGYVGLSDTAAFRNMDTRYGIIPIPKQSAEQEQYHNSISNYTLAMNIPIVAADPERTGLVMDYLSYLSYNDVIPVVQEAMCYKGLRDVDSMEMLELILKSEVLDFGNCAGITSKFLTAICADIPEGNSRFASTFASQEKSMNENLAKLLHIDE